MARIKAGDIEIGYEIWGPQGAERVLRLAGLGGPKESRRFQVPALAQSFEVLAVDNSGVGESDKPDHPYSIQMFAPMPLTSWSLLDGEKHTRSAGTNLDGAATTSWPLLDGEKHTSCASPWGGMIAQKFSIGFPHMNKSLAVLCWSAGGSKSVPPPAFLILETGILETGS